MHLRHHQPVRFLLASLLVSAALAGAATAASAVTERVSVSSSGAQGNDISGRTGPPAISADGNAVAFDSIATNLVPAATSGQDDIYVRDRSPGATELVSISTSGTEPDGSSFLPDLSGDGRYVAFQSVADNLVKGDSNGVEDVFVYDRATHTTTRASVAGNSKDANSLSLGASISDDGRYVAFRSDATNLVKGARPTSIYVRDLVKRKTELASVASDGTPANSFNFNADISGNGRYVAFDSQATNLAPGDDGNITQIFVHDRVTGTTVQASVDNAGTPGNGTSTDPSISADGRYVAFDSDASNLVPGDTNGVRDVFVHDMVTGQTIRVSVDSAGNQGNEMSDISIRGGATFGPAISGDGRYVTFDSAASNLVADDTNTCTLADPQPVYDFPISGQCPDVFVHDLQTGETIRASVDSSGAQADGPSTDPAINGDGSAVAFFSPATNLVPGDTNTCGVFPNPGQCPDIFVHTP
jgi:Tol biopolymer transport system component